MAPDVPQPVLDYLGTEKTVTLATASADGVPHASTFMYVNNGSTLYFWARPTSTTAQHVQANPRVSFAIDEYVPDWNKAKGIQGDGRCELVSDGDEVAHVVGLFADRFPSPSSGASTTNITFFKITPTALQFIDNEGARIGVSEDEFGMHFHREQVLSE
ncbi:MAG: pyridoxamine 5'-phosphate oxidase family protein [Solirubrobacterales bacterium]|nr:pyridoxamine 5'-phosphate oxidase family protein [Solirubrobacterales bacterium]